MSRYIDADKLKEELKKQVDIENADELWEGWHACTIAVDEAIKRTPTADVRKNVRGEWQAINIDVRAWTVQCSNCNCIGLYGKTAFCPNCGAKMEVDV